MRDDPVYANFVLAGWRADRERAEAERVRAMAAEREAEQERRRAEHLAESLRALGLDPEEPAPPES